MEGTQVGTPHTASEEAMELAVSAEASVLEATTADASSGEAEAASSPPEASPEGAEEERLQEELAREIVGIVASACDVAMPRSHPRKRRAAYWWTQEIAEIRNSCVRARRLYTSARRNEEGDVAGTKWDYLNKREALKAAIKEAKEKAWERLVDSLDEDPWGRPYKRTVGKIRPWAPTPTESMEPQDLEGCLDTLFPRVEGDPPRLPVPELRDGDWNEDLGVSLEEFARARKRLGAKGKAPGPDGIPGRAWALALGERNLSAATRNVLDKCLKERHVRDLARTAVEERGKVLLAVSLNITAFAFNTLPWPEIGRVLEYHEVPVYLQRILSAYFRDKDLAYSGRGGIQGWRRMERGVLQGSVLGPLLWNIAFDRVLRFPLPLGAHAVCYADDTLVLAEGENWGEARLRAETALSSVVGTIRDLGLKVATQKTQAMLFHRRRGEGRPRKARVLVDGVCVRVGPTIKLLASRVRKLSTALAGLMRTQGGPGWRARRLYVGVVHSVALYGAPIWAPRLLATGRNKNLIRQAMRPVVMRAIQGYVTVSYLAATTLAGFPPVELLAEERFLLCWRTKELRGREEGLSVMDLRALKAQACARTLDKWSAELADPRGIRKEPTTECHHCPERVDSAQHTLVSCPAWDQRRRVLARAVGCRVVALSLPRMVRAMCEIEEVWGEAASFCKDIMSQKEAGEWERRPSDRPRRRRRGRGSPGLRSGPEVAPAEAEQ
ncbi:uncharacterized protein LOC112590593 [Harpegnathos saltator]|uniref:uncharacterized protein LOC112590593 n=1 Tax=Harpegnathos saltator TaxID=610380 RepID=UPI000DBEDEE6|nr:uncharacterized protein LOC112590593 [Harpegnathos saltator]